MSLLILENVLIVFLFFLVLFLLIDSFKKRKSSKKEARKIYIGGENLEPQQLNVESSSFYEMLIKAFKFDKLKRMHTGDLNDYLTCMLAGMIIIIIVMVFLW